MALTQVPIELSSTPGIVDNSNATAITIDSSENVGIGATSPTAVLDVRRGDASGAVAEFHTSTGFGIELGSSQSEAYIQAGSNQALLFNTNASNERMRITSGGSVLVNSTTTATTTKFQATGASAAFAGTFVNPAGVAGYGVAISSGSGEAMYFYHGGTVATAVVGRIATTSSSTSYVTSSDQRLKENIADADDAGSKVDAIQVRKFDWKVDGSHQDYGMVAQELQSVAPEAVSGDADSDEMMGVDYSKLVPMLVKEIQSLRARVNALESE